MTNDTFRVVSEVAKLPARHSYKVTTIRPLYNRPQTGGFFGVLVRVPNKVQIVYKIIIRETISCLKRHYSMNKHLNLSLSIFPAVETIN